MTEPSTEPTTEATEEPTEAPAPSIVATEAPPAVEDGEFVPPIPYAPGFVVCVPYGGTSTDVSIQWGQPNEGKADRFVVNVAGLTLECDGDTTQATVTNLPAGTSLIASVEAHIGGNSGFLTTPEVFVNDPENPVNPLVPQEG